MAEYIDRDAALKAIEDVVSAAESWLSDNREYRQGLMAAHCTIADVPDSDVRPVERGTWETAWLDNQYMGCRPTVFYCPFCYQVFPYRTPFCPNCGADMRRADDG